MAIFREIPPSELVIKVLESFGLKSLEDASWFCKSTIRLDILERILPELEPYYIPCKALHLHEDISPSTAITILRHVIKPYQVKLHSAERGRYSVKTVWYQLFSDKIHNLTIEFN